MGNIRQNSSSSLSSLGISAGISVTFLSLNSIRFTGVRLQALCGQLVSLEIKLLHYQNFRPQALEKIRYSGTKDCYYVVRPFHQNLRGWGRLPLRRQMQLTCSSSSCAWYVISSGFWTFQFQDWKLHRWFSSEEFAITRWCAGIILKDGYLNSGSNSLFGIILWSLLPLCHVRYPTVTELSYIWMKKSSGSTAPRCLLHSTCHLDRHTNISTANLTRMLFLH